MFKVNNGYTETISVDGVVRVHCRPLLGATIAPKLVSWVLKKFSLEMVKNGICFGGASQQKVFFQQMCPHKTHPCPPFSRIGPGCTAFIVDSDLLNLSGSCIVFKVKECSQAVVSTTRITGNSFHSKFTF